MDYEKEYKEALERAKKILEFYKNPAYTEVYAYAKEDIPCIFHELKESEDERIRKTIIGWVSIEPSTTFEHGFSKEEILDWLEKQGEQTSWKPSKEEMDVLYSLAYITNQYDEHKEEVITRLYQDLKREFFNGSSYENMFPNTEDGVRRRSTIQVLEYARSLDTYNQYGKADIDKNIAFLKKQGEQMIVLNNKEESNEGNCGIDGLCYAKTILEKTLGKVEGYQTDDGILEHKSAINAVEKTLKSLVGHEEKEEAERRI